MRHMFAMGWSSLCVAGALLATAACGSSDHTGPSANTTKDYITGVQATITPAAAQVRLPGSAGGKINAVTTRLPAHPGGRHVSHRHRAERHQWSSGTHRGREHAAGRTAAPDYGKRQRQLLDDLYIDRRRRWLLAARPSKLRQRRGADPPAGRHSAAGSPPCRRRWVPVGPRGRQRRTRFPPATWRMPISPPSSAGRSRAMWTCTCSTRDGYEVYFAYMASPQGGKLDIDSTPGARSTTSTGRSSPGRRERPRTARIRYGSSTSATATCP